MNKKQLNDLKAMLSDVITAAELTGDWSVELMDDAGVEITLGNNGLKGKVLDPIIYLHRQFRCELDIFYDREQGLVIQVTSEENGGLTDEANAKYEAFEAYEKAGGELQFEAWLALPENKHLDV